MVNGEGETQDGNGMPPAVTVPEPDQVANNSTMGNPGLSCSHEGCDYQTPKYSGPECICLLYTSPSPRDQRGSRMPSSA